MNIRLYIASLTSLLLLVTLPTSSHAQEQDVCSTAAIEAERILRIPAYLLQAIAFTESGKWDKQSQRMKPWPWAVGAQKKSWYFNTQKQAISHVKNLQSQGVTNIDIGCMQINLHYHGKTFASLDEAFNPINNIAYAGIFLTELFRSKDSWNEAVKFYHSANPKFNRRYIRVVYKSWQKLRSQAQDSTLQSADVGLHEPTETADSLPEENEISSLDAEKNREIQSILLSEKDRRMQEKTLLKDIIRYDAFARVAASQQLKRQFDLNLDNVPPPIILPEELLRTIEDNS